MSTNEKSNGIGFGAALLLLFIGLKLGKVIAWSWLWVFSPLWLPLAMIVTFYTVLIILAVFAKLLVGIRNNAADLYARRDNSKDSQEPRAGKTLGL